MRRLLKYTTLILMVLMLSGSVWADTYTDHVTTAPNNKGDVLIFPWYMALDGGWQTKLTVINTDQVNSVVAKLIVRSFKNSEELLDFFLYLSPADVWTGKLKYDTTLHRVVMYSDDDSALSAIAPALVWASTTPINVPLFPLTCADDLDAIGYVEVIAAAAGKVKTGAPGEAKADIYADFAKVALGTSNMKKMGEIAQASRINSLAGYMQFMNTTAGLDASLRATTLKDYGNTENMSTGAETRIGLNAINSLAEVEAALTKNHLALPYVKGDDIAFHMFTFPTKLTGVDKDCKVTKADSPFFTDNYSSATYKFCVPYTIITYDLTEKSPTSGTPYSGGDNDSNSFCYEVNFLASTAFEYAEGWAYYAFESTAVTTDVTDNGDYLRYKGAPVIPTYFYIGTGGLSANYGAWTDDYVYCSSGVTTLTDYQYTDAIAVPTGCTIQ